MSKAKEKIKKAEDLTFNALKKVYDNASESYQKRVGKYERGDDLTTFGQPIIDYNSIANEFLPALVQLVAFPIFQSHMWNNRLASLKKGTKPYGFDIEDIYTNPTNPTPYNPNDFSRILKGTKQDTISAFYRENRHDVFQKTITKDMLRGAFRDVVAFSEFVDTLIQTIYAGNEIQEYNLTKRALNECYDASMFIEKGIDLTTANGIQTAVEDVKNAYEHFQFPSTAYNNYAVYSGTGKLAKVWTNPDDIMVIAKIDAINAIKVKYLAGVFNLTEVEFRNRLILVDDFCWDEYDVDEDGVTGVLKEHHPSNIEMVVCDAGLFQIYDTMEVSTEFFNGGNLATNYFLHVWQTYGIRPWANCLVFVNENSEITSVTPASGTDAGSGITYTVAPETYVVSGADVDVVNVTNVSGTAFEGMTPANYADYIDATYSNNTVTFALKESVTGTGSCVVVFEIGNNIVTGTFTLS